MMFAFQFESCLEVIGIWTASLDQLTEEHCQAEPLLVENLMAATRPLFECSAEN